MLWLPQPQNGAGTRDPCPSLDAALRPGDAPLQGGLRLGLLSPGPSPLAIWSLSPCGAPGHRSTGQRVGSMGAPGRAGSWPPSRNLPPFPSHDCRPPVPPSGAHPRAEAGADSPFRGRLSRQMTLPGGCSDCTQPPDTGDTLPPPSRGSPDAHREHPHTGSAQTYTWGTRTPGAEGLWGCTKPPEGWEPVGGAEKSQAMPAPSVGEETGFGACEGASDIPVPVSRQPRGPLVGLSRV